MDVSSPHTHLRMVIGRKLPGFDVRAIVSLGEGMDNAAWEVNGELIVRQGKEADPDIRAEAVRREASLLAEVARFSPLPVPEPVFTDPDAGVLAYPRLPGVPLNRSPSTPLDSIAPALCAFLAAIHRAPLPTMEALVERDVYPHADWLLDAGRDYRAIAGHLSPAQRALVEDFLGRTPPPEPGKMVFCHNDLGSEHVLVDAETGAATGIIDWTDAAIADPVRDFALLWRDLGPDAIDAMLARYHRPLDDADRERILFHARCALIEDIAYGLTTGDPIYADTGLAQLDRTFASG